MIFSKLAGAAALAFASFAALPSIAAASQAITLDTVELRAAPLGTSSLLGNLGKGSTVGVLWCGPEVSYCLIKFHAETGWVLADDLAATGSPKAVAEDSKTKKRTPPDPATIVEAPIKGGNSPDKGPTYTEVTPPIKLINP